MYKSLSSYRIRLSAFYNRLNLSPFYLPLCGGRFFNYPLLDTPLKHSSTFTEWSMNWRLYVSFICVLRRLKRPALRPPQAFRNIKTTTPNHRTFAECGTSTLARRVSFLPIIRALPSDFFERTTMAGIQSGP
jgi:hypothetical protein